MLLTLHITIALASLLTAGWAAWSPSRPKLQFGYGLTGLTLVTGTYLVTTTGAPLTPACSTGLIYLALVGATLALARHRLSA